MTPAGQPTVDDFFRSLSISCSKSSTLNLWLRPIEMPLEAYQWEFDVDGSLWDTTQRHMQTQTSRQISHRTRVLARHYDLKNDAQT